MAYEVKIRYKLVDNSLSADDARAKWEADWILDPAVKTLIDDTRLLKDSGSINEHMFAYIETAQEFRAITNWISEQEYLDKYYNIHKDIIEGHRDLARTIGYTVTVETRELSD